MRSIILWVEFTKHLRNIHDTKSNSTYLLSLINWRVSTGKFQPNDTQTFAAIHVSPSPPLKPVKADGIQDGDFHGRYLAGGACRTRVIRLRGYLNRIHSSRPLEREAKRNVELMWLIEYLL